MSMSKIRVKNDDRGIPNGLTKEQYKDIANKLDVHISSLEAIIEDLKHKNSFLNDQAAALKDELRDYQKGIEDLKKAKEQVDNQLKSYSAEVSSLRIVISQMAKEKYGLK